MALISATVLLRIGFWRWQSISFDRVEGAGISGFAKILRSNRDKDCYLIKGKFSNRARGFIFEVVLKVLALAGRLAVPCFLLGFVPWPEFRWFLDHRWELVAVLAIAVIANFEKPMTSGWFRNLFGTSFYVFFSPEKISILRFIFGLPWYRPFPYEDGMKITPLVEKYTEKVGRVVLRIGHNPVVLGHVYGHRDADLISNAFITLDHLKKKSFGLDREKIENSNIKRISYGAQSTRTE
ncbi:hypothetical protein MLD52_09535 [Puniceicoccaceae bacterium K14]|nr:hypothetical protein [Puniceicoccaceae bacterium K14]